MSSKIRLFTLTCMLVAVSPLTTESSAKAEVLNLQCSNPKYVLSQSYWIDFDKKTITDETFNTQTKMAVANNTYPVEITPTYFKWNIGIPVMIDRTTGINTWLYASSPGTYSCSVGHAPPPARKF